MHESPVEHAAGRLHDLGLPARPECFQLERVVDRCARGSDAAPGSGDRQRREQLLAAHSEHIGGPVQQQTVEALDPQTAQ